MRSFVAALCLWPTLAAEKPFHEAEFIFPLDTLHNHASSIVELPNGDLFACWYRGAGERSADDVVIRGARRERGKKDWSAPFLLADTAGFPDTNPALFLDSKKRLWLMWQAIVANEWHTAINKYRISSDYTRPGPPRWDVNEILLLVPRNFEAKVKEVYGALEPSPARDRVLANAADKYFSRMGWMTRAHATELPGGRILWPLYSDGYSFSLVAITDDGGATWTSSEPIVGRGSIQPSLVRKRDGAVVAYMRDNGPPPKRVHTSASRDQGLTWSPAVDTDLPNPGSGLEALVLRDGTWALIYNDTERGRASLVVALSGDEGATWKWRRHLEWDKRENGAGQFHYPSIVQARDGSLHASYSYFLNHLPRDAPRKTIKHAHFNVEWVKAGD
ncbi:MAG: sialidase family protein [Bryobacteraceae bacterium]